MVFPAIQEVTRPQLHWSQLVDLQCCKGAHQKHLQMSDMSQLVNRLLIEANCLGFRVTVLLCACAPLSTAPCRTSNVGQMCVLRTAEGDGSQGPAHILLLDLVCAEGWDRVCTILRPSQPGTGPSPS